MYNSIDPFSDAQSVLCSQLVFYLQLCFRIEKNKTQQNWTNSSRTETRVKELFGNAQCVRVCVFTFLERKRNKQIVNRTEMHRLRQAFVSFEWKNRPKKAKRRKNFSCFSSSSVRFGYCEDDECSNKIHLRQNYFSSTSTLWRRKDNELEWRRECHGKYEKTISPVSTFWCCFGFFIVIFAVHKHNDVFSLFHHFILPILWKHLALVLFCSEAHWKSFELRSKKNCFDLFIETNIKLLNLFRFDVKVRIFWRNNGRIGRHMN